MQVEKPKTSKDRIVLALDVDTIEEVEYLVKELKDYVGFFKVGLQLYSFSIFLTASVEILCNVPFQPE